jgi:hypothetical protein
MTWQSRIRRALAQDGFSIRHMERRWFTKGPFADMRMPGSKFTREWLVRIVADNRDGEPRAGWVRWQRGRPWEASDRWAVRWDDVPSAGVWDGTATRTTSLPTRVFVAMLLVAIAIIVIAALVPLLAQGAAQPATSRVVPQRFVCERSHTNFAWGYRHAGVFVDGTGAIYSFSTVKHHARDPKTPAGLTEGDMEAKYGPAKLVGTVPAERLLAMYRLIPAAAKGRQSRRTSFAFDFGSLVSSCYVFDAAAGRYQEVELDVKGDWAYHNLAPEAKTLASWLVSLEQRTGRQ